MTARSSLAVRLAGLFGAVRPKPRRTAPNARGASALLGGRRREVVLAEMLLRMLADRQQTSAGYVQIAGASGAGKSRLLRELARQASTAGVPAVIIAPLAGRISVSGGRASAPRSAGRGTLCCDVPRHSSNPPMAAAQGQGVSTGGFSAAEARWLAMLARFGLAQVSTLLCPVAKLSTGERSRHTLARGLFACEHAGLAKPVGSAGQLIVIDEFGTGLDDLTRASVDAALRKWCAEHRTGPSRLVVTARASGGSPHTAQGPDVMLYLPLAHEQLARVTQTSPEAA